LTKKYRCLENGLSVLSKLINDTFYLKIHPLFSIEYKIDLVCTFSTFWVICENLFSLFRFVFHFIRCRKWTTVEIAIISLINDGSQKPRKKLRFISPFFYLTSKRRGRYWQSTDTRVGFVYTLPRQSASQPWSAFHYFHQNQKKKKKEFHYSASTGSQSIFFFDEKWWREETEEIILLRKYVSFFVIFRIFFSRFWGNMIDPNLHRVKVWINKHTCAYYLCCISIWKWNSFGMKFAKRRSKIQSYCLG